MYMEDRDHPHSIALAGRNAEWAVLRSLRWGPAKGDPTPGIEVGFLAPRGGAFRADGLDPYALAERRAIQSEGVV